MFGFRIMHPGHPASLKIAAKRYAPDVDVDGPQTRVRDYFLQNRTTTRIAGKLVASEDDWSAVPREIMLPYATQDAWLTINSMNGLQEQLTNYQRPARFKNASLPELVEVFNKECELLKVVAEMERVGFPVSNDRIASGLAESSTKLSELRQDWEDMGYGDVNPGSTMQLKKLLYETLRERVKHVTEKGNPSTGEFALRDMENRQIGNLLVDMRGWKKYRERLMELNAYRATDGRVHASFKADGARTGRFSCADPALQNLSRPDPSKPYTMVRDVFTPPPGFEFLFCDFSQIELRLAAQYLGDEEMKQAFVDGVDFHSLTASRAYGIPVEQVTKNQRNLCKILNFSILYGAGKRRITAALRYGAAGSEPLTRAEALNALAQLISVTKNEEDLPDSLFELQKNELGEIVLENVSNNPARQRLKPIRLQRLEWSEVSVFHDQLLFETLAELLLNTYHRENPMVRKFTKRASDAAAEHGYVVTAFGFIIPIPKERTHIAGNGIIQGSAAGLMKETLLRTNDVCVAYCQLTGLKMLTTIHDEVGILVRTGHARELARRMYPALTTWPQFSVKIDVEFSIVPEGSSWAFKQDLKHKELFAA
jgi:DNA polymerase I-like protein with 3'-5' exonuclease and polymerase domains